LLLGVTTIDTSGDATEPASSSVPDPLVADGSLDVPSAYVGPSLLTVADSMFPFADMYIEPPSGFPDFSLFFSVS
jgi:hypothetical protein